MTDKLDKFGDAGIRGITIDNGICNKCKHVNEDGMTCKAFPNGIPKEILNGDFKHRRPYEGDNGIRFIPIGNTS